LYSIDNRARVHTQPHKYVFISTRKIINI